MSYISSIVQYAKILLTGYIAYQDPSTNNTRLFTQNLSKIFEDDIIHPSSSSSNFTQYSSTLDETKDTPSKDDDHQDVVCQVCMCNKRNVVLIPCVHSITCIKCTKELIKGANKCPICNAKIKDSEFYFVS